MDYISGKIIAICTSKERGTIKNQVDSANLIENWGIEGDAHAGKWHRQVSLLSNQKIEEFKCKGAIVSFGDFGENIVADGFDFGSMPVGTRLAIGDAILELTQIGKECHSHCQIYQRMGDCIMPREGVFAEVIKSGRIKTGDEIRVIDSDDKRFTAAVITLSDKGAKGQREDESGPVLVKLLNENGYKVVENLILPDEQEELEKELIRLADSRQVNLVLTTGGTGFSIRDITPEATMAVATRNAPGIAEAIRAESMKITRRAMLSRGASVIRNNTLIINLPGSPKGAAEGFEVIKDQLEHGLGILLGRTGECGRR